MTISVFFTVELSFVERIDYWVILPRYVNLQRLEFSLSFNSFYESMLNIEPLMELKEITFDCVKINENFFDNIIKLAPNVEVLELDSQFKLIKLSQLKKLNKIKLNSTGKKDHSVNDIGVIQLLIIVRN